MDYGDYLHLDEVLSAQHPLSDSHDELLFIVQHQTSELWMQLMLHELGAAIGAIREERMDQAFKMLSRVSRIMEQLVHAWDVLATMTPSEYAAIRPALGASSGFQSWQYRCIEFLVGNKNADMLQPHVDRPSRLAAVQTAFAAPSLYDETIALLRRRGLHGDVEDAWLEVYRDPATHWDLYQLAEELVDLEDAFRLWRFRHLTTVARIIGDRRGTGGTSGVGYLRSMLDVVLFPELWSVRTRI